MACVSSSILSYRTCCRGCQQSSRKEVDISYAPPHKQLRHASQTYSQRVRGRLHLETLQLSWGQ